MQQSNDTKETSDNASPPQSIQLDKSESSKAFFGQISLQNNKNSGKKSKQSKQKKPTKNIIINNLSEKDTTPKSEIQLNNKAKECQVDGVEFQTGKWSDEEHENFILGILKYGNKWKKVQQIIKTRSSDQARTHAQKFFLKIKKQYNLDEKNSNDENNKILDKIIYDILPGKNGIKLTKNQKENLLCAISCNIKLEEESEDNDDLHLSYEEYDNLRIKSDINESSIIIKNNKISFDLGNLFVNDDFYRTGKCSLGKKRKPSKSIESKDKTLDNKKEEYDKPSFDSTFMKMNEKENNDLNEINNLHTLENYYNHKTSCNNEYINKFLMNNSCQNNNNDKNNLIINNVINVTNNIINNNFIYNIFNSENINNNCNPDLNFSEKYDPINNEKNQYFFGNCKNQFTNDKTYLNENQLNKYINDNNPNNSKINYNESSNNEDPFQLNFNNISTLNFSDFEKERQMNFLENDLFG